MFIKFLNGVSRICFEEDKGAGDDGKGAGAGGGNSSMLDIEKVKNDQPGGDEQKKVVDQEDPNKKPDDQKLVEKPGDKMARPDWLKADKFWDPDKGEIRTEQMMKAYEDLEKKFTAGDHKAPAKAEDYKLTISDEHKAILLGDPKGDISKDPYIKGVTEWAAKNKISQDAVNELLANYAELTGPEISKAQIDIEAEKAVLGKNADAIINNQVDFLGHLYRSGHINDKHLEEAKILMETAAGVQLLQVIRQYYGEQPIPLTSTSGDGQPTKEELAAQLNDPKYDTDPDYRAKVDAAYAKRYGTQAAMSSAQNR